MKFRPEPRSMTFEVGSSESITCHAEAENPPVIHWLRIDDESGGVHDRFPPGVTSTNGMSQKIFVNYLFTRFNFQHGNYLILGTMRLICPWFMPIVFFL